MHEKQSSDSINPPVTILRSIFKGILIIQCDLYCRPGSKELG